MSSGFETEYFVPDEADIELEEPGRSAMDEVEVQGLIGGMADEGLLWRETHLDPFLSEATDYYMGEPFGNEEDGRSQVIVHTVRDTYRQTAPSLLRVFFGPESAVEFQPREERDVPIAAQQTDAVNFVIREDNPGFLVFHHWFKDALIRRLGIVKWWWQDNRSAHIERFSGVTLEEIGFIQARFEEEVGVNIDVVSSERAGIRQEDEEPLYDVEVRVEMNDGRAKFDVVPPESIIWSPSARDREDARMLGHVEDVPGDFLIAQGYDEDLVMTHLGDVRERHSEEVESSRRAPTDNEHRQEDDQDDVTRPVQFAELYVRADVDGDGIAELRRFECIGTDWVVANGDGMGELVDEIPFAFLCPDPEPHAFVGLGQADTTMQIQKMKSFVARAMFDSLAHAIDPVTEVVSGEVNMKDVMSRSLSRVIRANRPGMVREVPHRWVGGEALEALRFLDEMNEQGTGQMRVGQGLQPDALQSSTQAAVQASVEGAQQQLELIARIFAETGVKDLFRGLLRLQVQHQDETRRRVMRLRGEFVPVDVSKWDATMDVRVNVALGTGLVQERLAMLDRVLEWQFRLVEMGAPIVDWGSIRATIVRAVELGGETNPSEFFLPYGEAERRQAAQQAQMQAQQPQPEERLLMVEETRAQTDAFEAQENARLKELEIRLRDDRERDKLAKEFAIRGEELRAEFVTARDQAAIRAESEITRAQLDADLRREEMIQNAEQPEPGGEAI